MSFQERRKVNWHFRKTTAATLVNSRNEINFCLFKFETVFA